MNTFQIALCSALFATVSQAQLVRQANSALNLPTELPTATGYGTENALGALTFSNPIGLASPPGVKDLLFVVERNAGIQMVDLDSMTKSVFLNLSSYLSSQGERLRTDSENGTLSMAFHPNYNENGHYFVFYSVERTGQLYQRVARFKAFGSPGRYNEATSTDLSEVVSLISQRDQAGNHNGGDIAFGPDGYLYISVGDEGGRRDQYDNARRIAKDFFGGILRIDVDHREGSLPPNPHAESSTSADNDSAVHERTYAIPADNPFTDLKQSLFGGVSYNGFTFAKEAIRTEFYAIGLRNVWRMSFDPVTGRLFAGDVGQDAYEEIDIITNGFNGGWSWREGKQRHTNAPAPSNEPTSFAADEPIFDYDQQNNGSGNDAVIYGESITGGVVYRGDRLPELYGKYVFCDYNTGVIAALSEQPDGTWTGERLGSDSRICAFGYDPRNGDALMCDLQSGEVKRLHRTGTQGEEPPARLSETGLFSDTANLIPETGVVAYTPNVSFWSDHAVKSRWFSIGNMEDNIGFQASGSFELPTGMVWVKHFDLDTNRGDSATRRKLETRLLVRTTDGTYGLSYRWREDQSDADLVSEEGMSEMVPESSPAQEWRYPSRSECFACHTDTAGHALSFNARQLNRMHNFGGTDANQLDALASAGYFSEAIGNVREIPALAPIDDESVSLEWRVRSYLDTNCAQCHQPGGNAPGFWDARAIIPTDLAKIINGELVNDGGDTANRVTVPGDATHSMLLLRLAGDQGARMPPLTTSERDTEAENLIRRWIEETLPDRQEFALWEAEHFQPGQFANLSLTEDTLSITFEHPGNRSAVVETSTDLKSWTLWDVPGNLPFFPANSFTRSIEGSTLPESQSFRIRVSSP